MHHIQGFPNSYLNKMKYRKLLVNVTTTNIQSSDLIRVHDSNYLMRLKKLVELSRQVEKPLKIDVDTYFDESS